MKRFIVNSVVLAVCFVHSAAAIEGNFDARIAAKDRVLAPSDSLRVELLASSKEIMLDCGLISASDKSNQRTRMNNFVESAKQIGSVDSAEAIYHIVMTEVGLSDLHRVNLIRSLGDIQHAVADSQLRRIHHHARVIAEHSVDEIIAAEKRLYEPYEEIARALNMNIPSQEDKREMLENSAWYDVRRAIVSAIGSGQRVDLLDILRTEIAAGDMLSAEAGQVLDALKL